MIKADVARSQLGTALHLFLQDVDPVSVHCLARGGGEIAEWLAQKARGENFATRVRETLSEPDEKNRQAFGRHVASAHRTAGTSNLPAAWPDSTGNQE
jgi:hypothetical protein